MSRKAKLIEITKETVSERPDIASVLHSSVRKISLAPKYLAVVSHSQMAYDWNNFMIALWSRVNEIQPD